MCVRFGAYEKTYSTDSEATTSAVSVACAVSAFVMPFMITLSNFPFPENPRVGFIQLLQAIVVGY